MSIKKISAIVTVASIASIAIVSVAGIGLSLGLTLLHRSLAETPDGAANIGGTSPRVTSDAWAPGKAGLSFALLDGPLSKTPGGWANVARASPGVDSDAWAPGKAGFGFALANSAAVTGGLGFKRWKTFFLSH
jgi:hypothetical protein